MAKKKTNLAQELESIEEEVPVLEAVFNELDCQLQRQKELLELREALTTNGVDSLSKLDVLLGQVNERVRQLTS